MKRVFVIGAAGALGKAVVETFQKQQWSVVGVDVLPSASQTPYCHYTVPSGISMAHLQEAYLASVGDHRLDAVINVAGGWSGGTVSDPSTAASTEEMLRQSLFSSVAASHVFSAKGNNGGLLLFTGAAAATAPTPGMIGYGTAKAAVHFLCQSVAADSSVLPADASVLAILPTTLDTPGNRVAMPDADRSTWTPLDSVAEQILQWSNGVSRPASGSLVRIVTEKSTTRFIS